MFVLTVQTRFLVVGIAAALAAPLLLGAEQALAPVNSSGNTGIAPVRDMHLMTASMGWALAGEEIFWTDTEGQSWSKITPPLERTQRIDGAYFLDASHGWAVLHTWETTTGLSDIFIALTTDGGKSWSIKSLQADAFRRQTYGNRVYFSFADEMHGRLILQKASNTAHSNGDLFATADGGQTWAPLPSPPIGGEIQFFPDSSGWLEGGVNGNQLYRTLDGGQTWVQKVMPLPAGITPYSKPEGMGLTYHSEPFYMGPHFANEQEGIIAVIVHIKEIGDDDLLTYTTSDGGDTWVLQTTETDVEGTPGLFDSTFVEVGSPDKSLSLRHGSHRMIFPLPKDGPKILGIVKMDFLDSQHAWFLDIRGSLLGLSDGNGLKVLIHGPPPAPPGAHPPPRSSPPAKPPGSPMGGGLERVPNGNGPHPLIGGATGASAMGIDSCQGVPPQFANSLYEAYGQEVQNGNYNVVYGFYLGGLEAVHTPNPNCSLATAALINATACQGWSYLPIWDGYQAPCGPDSVTIRSNLATAAAEGTGDAESVYYQLINIGLSGSIAYLDIEAYPTGNSSCSQSVQTYVSAWIWQMHQYGLYAGVYGSADNIAQDMVPGVIPNIPDDVWVANYNGQAETSSLSPIPPDIGSTHNAPIRTKAQRV